MALRPHDIRALELLTTVLHDEGWTFVVIGASVPWILAAQGAAFRVTRDIDVVVNTRTWKDFERLGQGLQRLGFTQRYQHQFISAEGAQIDLLPLGDGIVQNDRITWTDGTVMSALGLAEAFATSVERQISERLTLRVATEPAIALLKMIAYTDRPASRSKDLGDLVDAFVRYEDAGDRRFDLHDVSIDDQALQFEEAGAYLLGQDVAALASVESREPIAAFLGRFTDAYSTPMAQVLAEEKRSGSDARRAQVWRLFRVFRAGVERR